MKMTAAMPATNVSNIAKSAGEIIVISSRYISPNDFTYRRLVGEAMKILHIDPALGHATLAFVKQLSGDFEGVIGHLNNASRMGSPYQAAATGLTCYVNLGMFSDASKCYILAADPKVGNFSMMREVGIACGSFRSYREHDKIAALMKIDLSQFKLRNRCLQAADLLDRTGTTDDEVTALLDIAGELLRENSLFFMGLLPELTVIDDDDTEHCVFLNFAIAERPEKVSDMMFELANRAAERLPRIPPGFSVGFSAVAA